MYTFRLNGYVSALNVDEPQEDFAIGQSWSIEILYDENSEDSTEWSPGIDMDETDGRYGDAITDFKFESGNFSLETDHGGIYILNNKTGTVIPTGETVFFDNLSFYPQFGGFPPEFTANRNSVRFSFFDLDAEVFDSDTLPTSTPNLDLFESRSGILSWSGGLDRQSISLQTTSWAIIPEPSLLSFGVGLTSLSTVLLLRVRKKICIEPVAGGDAAR
jgi:hypothetical protein